MQFDSFEWTSLVQKLDGHERCASDFGCGGDVDAFLCQLSHHPDLTSQMDGAAQIWLDRESRDVEGVFVEVVLQSTRVGRFEVFVVHPLDEESEELLGLAQVEFHLFDQAFDDGAVERDPGVHGTDRVDALSQTLRSCGGAAHDDAGVDSAAAVAVVEHNDAIHVFLRIDLVFVEDLAEGFDEGLQLGLGDFRLG